MTLLASRSDQVKVCGRFILYFINQVRSSNRISFVSGVLLVVLQGGVLRCAEKNTQKVGLTEGFVSIQPTTATL